MNKKAMESEEGGRDGGIREYVVSSLFLFLLVLICTCH